METEMQPRIQPENAYFQAMMEKHFGERVKLEDIKAARENFEKDLRKGGLSGKDIWKRYDFLVMRNYFSHIDANAKMPLYKSRDYALGLFAHVFDDLVQDEDAAPVSKKHIVMSLCGILNFPHDIFKDLDKIANNRESVLIMGETGTGKELYAKALHYLSPARKEQYNPINCAGIPDTLLESELFGHEKGAFTGADKKKQGLLEVVGEGTLFLDEIGDMSLAIQAKLLRVLETRDFYRLGSTVPHIFKGRVIAATNKNLKREIQQETPAFRPDLFYRLSVLDLELPTLRDMPYVVKRVIIGLMHQRAEVDLGYAISEVLRLDEDVQECLLQYNYPGNFRELYGILKRGLIISGGSPIEMRSLPDEVKSDRPRKAAGDPPTARSSETIKDVRLIDIIPHAESVKASMVKLKIEEICGSGLELKKVIQTEMGDDFTESAYQSLRNRLEKALGGTGTLRAIRNKVKK
jgi:transcriptional regulator with GAF, ATPase, and Fis domain